MVNEVVRNLITDTEGIYLDGTVGFGGHAEAILKKISPSGHYIGIDCDLYALEYTKNRLSLQQALHTLHHVNYRNFLEVLSSMNISKVNGLFFDLGISSYQVDSRHRGFAYQKNGPLDMRFNQNNGISAYEFINSSSKNELGEIIRYFGEEYNWKKISSSIMSAVRKGEMKTTNQLKIAIESVTPKKYMIKTLSRVFQAIRIHVNKEIDSLKIALKNSIKCLSPGGRIAIITFHSIEDRLVKKFFLEESISCICPREYPVCTCKKKPTFKVVTKKPIVPNEIEIFENPRSRSAKLRIAEKI